MSSPKITRMFGFFCWATAGAAKAVRANRKTTADVRCPRLLTALGIFTPPPGPHFNAPGAWRASRGEAECGTNVSVECGDSPPGEQALARRMRAGAPLGQSLGQARDREGREGWCQEPRSAPINRSRPRE